jgi:hypothetical protein
MTLSRSYRTRIRRNHLSQQMVRSTAHRTFPSPLPCGAFRWGMGVLIPSQAKNACIPSLSYPRSAYSSSGSFFGRPALPPTSEKSMTVGRISQWSPAFASTVQLAEEPEQVVVQQVPDPRLLPRPEATVGCLAGAPEFSGDVLPAVAVGQDELDNSDDHSA